MDAEIGTASPGAKLDVNGVIGVYDSGVKTYNGGIASEVSATLWDFGANEDSSNRYGGTYTSAAQGGIFRVDVRSGQPLFNWLGRTVSSTAIMQQLLTITSAGNIGIGMTSPGTALQVNGTVTATTFSGAGTNRTGTAARLTAGQAYYAP